MLVHAIAAVERMVEEQRDFRDDIVPGEGQRAKQIVDGIVPELG